MKGLCPPLFAYQSVYIIYIATQDKAKSDESLLHVCSVVCREIIVFSVVSCCFGFDVLSLTVAFFHISFGLSEIESISTSLEPTVSCWSLFSPQKVLESFCAAGKKRLREKERDLEACEVVLNVIKCAIRPKKQQQSNWKQGCLVVFMLLYIHNDCIHVLYVCLPFNRHIIRLYCQTRTHTSMSQPWVTAPFGPLWPLVALQLSTGRVCVDCYWYPSCCARWKILTDAIPPVNHLHIYFLGQTAPHALVATGDLICLSLIGYWLTLLWQWETINYRLLEEREVADKLSVGGCWCNPECQICGCIIYTSLIFIYVAKVGDAIHNGTMAIQARSRTRFICIGQCILVLFGEMVRERGSAYLELMSNSVWVSESLHLTWNWFLHNGCHCHNK